MRHTGNRKLASVTAALLITATLVILPAGPALALNSVTVTIVEDVVAGDGELSLREAFDVANSDGDDTEIILEADALYRICPDGPSTREDDNADGDLDHTEDNNLTIVGNGAEIRFGCSNDRVLHHTSTTSALILEDLQISGGDLNTDFYGSGVLSEGDLTLIGVTVTDNTGGPGVQVENVSGLSGTLVVTDSSITDNSPNGLRVGSGGTGTISDSSVSFNQRDGIEVAEGASATVTNTLVRENGRRGIAGIDGEITVIGSTVRDNQDAGIRNTGNSATFHHLVVEDTSVVRNGGGGVRCSFCSSLTISGSEILDNEGALFGGGGVFFRANLVGVFATISDTTISGNSTDESGGGAYFDVNEDALSTVTISNSVITDNRTGLFGDGGGIQAAGANLVISGSTIDDNFAKPEGILVGGQGGGIDIVGGSLSVTDSSIAGNFADADGGGIHASGATELVLTRTELSDNEADGNGGGGLAGIGPMFRFVETNIADNVSRLAGGGINVAGATVPTIELVRSSVSRNRSVVSTGGGIFTNVNGAQVELVNTTVSGNESFGQGGGILVIGTGSLALDQATIVGNDASTSANVHWGGTLTTFGSVIGEPLGGGVDCFSSVGSVISGGHNFDSDGTCSLGAGTDVSNGGDPMLGPLGLNSAATLSHLPAGGSPLIDTIPPATCDLVQDQRGVARPQDGGCEIGATELTSAEAEADDGGVVIWGASTAIDVLGNDTDPDGTLDPSTLLVVAEPRGGEAVPTHGRILYTAGVGFRGTDTFTYEVCSFGRRTCTQAEIAIDIKAPRCTIRGTRHADVIVGTAGDDVICTFGGADLVFGRGGNDTILAGRGPDAIFAGAGADIVVGGPGGDVIFGGRGDDILFGNPGRDVLVGGPDSDELHGGPGSDTCFPGSKHGAKKHC